MKKIAILVLGLTLVAAGCNKSTPSDTNTGDSNTQTTPLSGTVTVKITATGFNPSTLTVKKGTTIVFESADSPAHWPASDPHPSHTGLPGFDSLRGLTQGQTYSYTFNKVGTWGMHDHLNAFVKGSVTVVE
jgi:plastocyanin